LKTKNFFSKLFFVGCLSFVFFSSLFTIPAIIGFFLALTGWIGLGAPGDVPVDKHIKYSLLAFLVVLLISSLASFAQIKSLSIWLVLFLIVLSCYFLLCFSRYFSLSYLYTSFYISIIVVLLLAVIELISGNYHSWIHIVNSDGVGVNRGRLTSVFYFPNDLAGFLVLTVPFFINKSGNLYIKISGLIVSLVVVYFTFSRAGWVSFMVALMVYIFFSRWFRWRFLSLCIIIMLGVLFFIIKSHLFVHYFSDLGRIVMWQNVIELIKDFPLTGVGMGNFKDIYPNYIQPHHWRTLPKDVLLLWHPHNIFLTITAESGILATVSFIYFLGVVLIKLLHKESDLPFLAGLAGFLLFNQVDFLLGFLNTNWSFWIFLCLAWLN